MTNHMDNQIEAERANDFAKLLKECMFRYPHQRVGEIIVSAMRKYEEKYGGQSKPGAAIWYEGFIVMDENTIRVEYGYGGGDQEMNDSFTVKT